MRKWTAITAAGLMVVGSTASAQMAPVPLTANEPSRFVTSLTAEALPNAKPRTLALYPGRSFTPVMMVATQTHQWPGVYSEVAFEGTGAVVKIDDNLNILHLTIDDQPPILFDKPGKIDYEIKDLSPGPHRIRLEKVTESQDGTAAFKGIYLVGAGRDLAAKPRARQIEFIGDSYTVGYGNTSGKQQCTKEEIRATTDTSKAFGPLTARHYDADYQINAYSGRGIVRNWDGGDGDPMPMLYPYSLFDGKTVYQSAAWAPQVIVIGLGTNDFSTQLHAGEKWQTRDALHADYEATYVKFVQDLRAKNPKAFFILMASDQADGEIESEVRKVIASLQAKGESRIAFVGFSGLDYIGCNWHPSIADDVLVSQQIITFIDAHPELWQGK